MTATLTGRGVLLWLGGFFAVIIAMNVYFITVSISTFRGEDEQKPYLQGIEYNTTLARRAEQTRLSWHAAVSATRRTGGHVVIGVTLKDHKGRALTGLTLNAELRHPSDENLDRALRLKAVSAGHYEADAGAVRAGQWDVMVTGADKNAAPFEAVRRVWVP